MTEVEAGLASWSLPEGDFTQQKHTQSVSADWQLQLTLLRNWLGWLDLTLVHVGAVVSTFASEMCLYYEFSNVPRGRRRSSSPVWRSCGVALLKVRKDRRDLWKVRLQGFFSIQSKCRWGRVCGWPHPGDSASVRMLKFCVRGRKQGLLLCLFPMKNAVFCWTCF